MKVFLSHASSESVLVERVAEKLRAQGLTAFRYQDTLKGGDEFDRRIQAAIAGCDIFVFFISSSSVAKGRYALTELAQARDRWPSPGGRVLPVMATETPMADIPPYLTQVVSILRPEGDPSAEIAVRVLAMGSALRRSKARPIAVAAVALTGIVAAVAGAAYRRSAVGAISEPSAGTAAAPGLVPAPAATAREPPAPPQAPPSPKNDIEVLHSDYVPQAPERIDAPRAEYSTFPPDDGAVHDLAVTGLRAKVDGHSYELIPAKADRCLSVEDVRDFDGNGTSDALIEERPSCSGNCCGADYFFVMFLGDGHFAMTPSFGYQSWTPVKITKWKGRWSVVVTLNNEGENVDRAQEEHSSYILDYGHVVKVALSTRQYLEAVKEVTSDQFIEGSGADEPPDLELQQDLDGDGRPDTIVASFWERWGRLLWRVEFATGKTFKSGVGCKRLGILSTASHGVLDLVCDHDSIFRWNGRAYVEPSPTDAGAARP